MKKSLVLGILGLAVTAVTSYGQGGISIGNYRGAYNPVVWAGTVGGGLGGTAVSSSAGVTITLFFGEGVLGAGQLTDSIVLPWNTFAQGNGYPGFYGDLVVALPQWSAGETYSFQLRASGNTAQGPATGSSVVWTESANIGFTGGNPPGLPGTSANSIGFTVDVPEPSTFALAGLGLAGLLVVRRRS
jgi:hypothetical protein